MATRSISRDFVSDERRDFKVQLGSILASALSGFVAGAVITSIIWMAAAYYFRVVVQ